MCMSSVCCRPFDRVGNMIVLKQITLPSGEPRIVFVVGPFWPVLVFVTYPLIVLVSVFVYVKIHDAVPFFLVFLWFAFTLAGQSKVLLFFFFFMLGFCFALRILPSLHQHRLASINQSIHQSINSINCHLCLSQPTVSAALFLTGCRDPGILPRYTIQPSEKWRWNDQVKSYRPPGAIYDQECGCVVEEFDHTCPWTGTAIGKKNMPAFKCFVGGICGLIVFDIILISGVLVTDISG